MADAKPSFAAAVLALFACCICNGVQAADGPQGSLGPNSFSSTWLGALIWHGESTAKRATLSLKQAGGVNLILDLGDEHGACEVVMDEHSPAARTIVLKPAHTSDCSVDISQAIMVVVSPDLIALGIAGQQQMIAEGTFGRHQADDPLALYQRQAPAKSVASAVEPVAAAAPSIPVEQAPEAVAEAAEQPVGDLPTSEPAQQDGTVVKPEEFWVRLRHDGTIREVLEGDFRYTDSVQFKLYYRAMQMAFSQACPNELPENVVRRGFVTQRVHSDGFREAPVEYITNLEPRFVEKYDIYEAPVSEFLDSQYAGQMSLAITDIRRGGNNLGGMLFDAANNSPVAQIGRFIEATGCKTASVRQLRENFILAAYGKPSLQSQQVQLAGAAQESAAPEEQTMFGSCRRQPYSSNRYCLCFERESKRVMTPTEFEYFKEDQSRYYTDVTNRIGGQVNPPPGDRIWGLYEIQRRCAD